MGVIIQRYLQEALDLSRQLDSPTSVADILVKWGELELKHERWDAAAQHFRECLEADAEVGVKKQDVAIAHYGLAREAFARGDISQAYNWAQKSLEAFEGTQHYRVAEVKDWLMALDKTHIEN